MKKAVIFGSGGTGEKLYYQLKDKYQILYFTDNDSAKYGKEICGLTIKSKDSLYEPDYDYVIVACICGVDDISSQLQKEFSLPTDKIITKYSEFLERPRQVFLKDFAALAQEKKLEGSVCEVGVFRGDFAKYINEYFPDKALYLFDTFEGFSEKDLQTEKENDFSSRAAGHFNITSVDLVLSKMPKPENCVIKKGYFPQTFYITDERFCFVNLDTDLYDPIKSGLEIFFPLMVEHGVILVHDYFSVTYKGVKQAVDEFASKHNLAVMPIGDGISIALVKPKNC